MKRITLVFLLIALSVLTQAQTQPYKIASTDSIQIGKTTGTGGTSLYGKVYLKNVGLGLVSDSILTVLNGRIRKIPRSGVVDSTVYRTVANSVSLAGFQTRLNAYMALAGAQTVDGAKTFSNATTTFQSIVANGLVSAQTDFYLSANNRSLFGRNAANTADISLIKLDASNQVSIASGGSASIFGGNVSATNLSGTNTGDETTSRINALYGYTPANGANYVPIVGGTMTGDLLLNYANPTVRWQNAGVTKLFTGIATSADAFITGSAINDAILRTGGGKVLFSTDDGASIALSLNGSSLEGKSINFSASLAGNASLVTSNTSATGFGGYIRGGAGTNYALYVTDYTGATGLFRVLGSGQTYASSLSGTGDRITYNAADGEFKTATIGSGLSLSAGVLSATGGAAGTVTATGLTAGYIAKGNSASDIGNSIMSETSGAINVAGTITATGGTVNNSGTGNSIQTIHRNTGAAVASVLYKTNGVDNYLFGQRTAGSNTFGLYNYGLVNDVFTTDYTTGATTFNYSLSASNLSGTNTGDQTTITGNAGTATALQTARTISGTSFDGTANITLNNTGITNGAGYITSSALSTYAPLASPALTGTPTAPTAAAGTNTTQIATTAFVQTAVSSSGSSGGLTFSGNGSQTDFNTGLSDSQKLVITATSSDAAGNVYLNAQTGCGGLCTEWHIIFTSAPASGTNNVSFNYILR